MDRSHGELDGMVDEPPSGQEEVPRARTTTRLGPGYVKTSGGSDPLDDVRDMPGGEEAPVDSETGPRERWDTSSTPCATAYIRLALSEDGLSE